MQNDSKRSWLVALGAFFLVGIAIGISNSFGVLFTSWTGEFQENRTKIAWIGSFHFIWYMCLCPACGILTRYFSFRPVVVLGSTFLCLGLLLSSFVKDIPLFYLTYGVIFGTGTCLLYMSSIIVLPFCFERHLAAATGVVSSACGGFPMWYGPACEYLIRHYGWRVTLRIVSLFFIPLLFACALFPSKKQIPREKGNGLNVRVTFGRMLKNKGFLTWVLLMVFVYLGLFVPQVHLISFCKDIGIPTYVSVYNITLMCGMETAGKLILGRMIDKYNWSVHTYNILALLTLAVSITLLPLAKTQTHVFIFSIFFGFAHGFQSLCVIIITPEVSHPDDAKHAVTYLFGLLSIPGGVGPVLAAWIFDVTRSYRLAFFISGGFFACAGCLANLIQLITSKTTIRSLVFDSTAKAHNFDVMEIKENSC
ncbi:monocarboxylate transporter 13-like [Dendronephthya gigantea]|uniref:monocarboxylate transporter 13-like n=1 Tax=Dendronephthya gigantea TaxID=151771 RepID=UPI00106AEA30|nr:monocarboxylate transporter 13-like [Dendronephthya gigantea]